MDKLLEQVLLNLKYNNPQINKSIKIYKRTKSKRIKDKHANKIFILAVKEKKTIQIEDCVLIDYDLYNDLLNCINKQKDK